MRPLHALSLDVVAGAACGGLLAVHMAGTLMPPAWWVALLSAVWCVYTADHLLDARRPGAESAIDRRVFHRKHARTLTLAVVSAIAIGLLAASRLPPPLQAFGLGLGVAVIAYLASAQGLVLATAAKEPLAGVLYSIGIWGGPIMASPRPRPALLVAAMLHAFAAILNLTTLGVFEAEADQRQGHRSLALRWGRDRVRSVLGLSGGIAMIAALAVWLGNLDESRAFAVLGVQAGAPAVLLLARSWFEPFERYRVWGDAVFLLGALPWLVRRFGGG